MEADDGPYAGLGKRRRNPNARPLVKAVMNQQHKRGKAEQEMPISIAPSFKRKRESMDEDMPQAKRLMADTLSGLEYYIDEDGISEVEIDGASYIVDIPDPFRDFHQKAFQMTECSQIFELIQSELMKRVPRDSISGELCDLMKTEMCRTYKEAARNIIVFYRGY